MAEKQVSLKSLLNTEKEDEQIKVVEQLLQAAVAPQIIITAALDTRSGNIDLLLNGKYTFEEVYTLLDLVRKEVTRQEREAILQKKEQ